MLKVNRQTNLEVSDRVRSVGIGVESGDLGVVEAREDVGGDAVANDRHVAGNHLVHDLSLQDQSGFN